MPTKPVGTIAERSWVFPAEAAKIIGVNDKTIYDWHKAGILPARLTIGNHRRYSRAAVERLAVIVRNNKAQGRKHFLFKSLKDQ